MQVLEDNSEALGIEEPHPVCCPEMNPKKVETPNVEMHQESLEAQHSQKQGEIQESVAQSEQVDTVVRRYAEEFQRFVRFTGRLRPHIVSGFNLLFQFRSRSFGVPSLPSRFFSSQILFKKSIQ